jgi:GDP-mannose 6-dehydrogenase
MEEFIKDRKLNISSYYMRPGMPFGGSCLPKDVSALGAFARQEGINLPILESVSPSNQAHLDHLLRQLVEFGKIRVLILGLTFKANTDDLRGSPMVALCETLIGRGYHVSIYDPVLSIQSLQGANLSEIQRRMPHLSSLLVDNAAESIKGAEVVLVSQRNISLECLTENINHDQIIFDLIGWSELNQLGCRVEGICW